MARTFNGSTDFIDVAALPSVVNTRTAFTWAGWVKAAPQNNMALVSQSNTGSGSKFLFLGTSATGSLNTIRLLISDDLGGTNLSVTGTHVALDSQWHQVCWTFDASGNYVLYVDGSVDLSGSVASASVTTNTANFGKLLRTSSANFLTGSLAHWARWSRALTPAEALQLALGVPPSYLAPDHYWTLAGTDSPELDTGSASAVNGTLTGTTSLAGPPTVGLATFISSLGRRPVPMIQGPDSDRIAGMRGRFK